jgi:hypothetical protein
MLIITTHTFSGQRRLRTGQQYRQTRFLRPVKGFSKTEQEMKISRTGNSLIGPNDKKHTEKWKEYLKKNNGTCIPKYAMIYKIYGKDVGNQEEMKRVKGKAGTG